MANASAGTTKLVQYLNEAYGVERRLETSLEAHIGMTTKASYRKRLREHLTETKRHTREVQKRIRALGGVAETVETPGPDLVGGVAQAVLSGAQKATALAQGPLHALRGTGEQEKMLKNAKTEYASESEEIAAYVAIEKLAETLGDSETQRLARAIRRDEQRMSSFLEKEIPRLTGEVARAEIPASERRKTVRAKAATARKRTLARASTARKPARAKASTARKPSRAKSAAPRRAGGVRTAR
jgi:ferritin-like metal-binding protein YciE